MPKKLELDHMTIIVPKGQGEEVLKLAKQKGIAIGTISKGLCTANKELLKELKEKGLGRDFVSLIASTDLAEIFLKEIAEHFGFGKPGRGIAYSVNVNDVYAPGLSHVRQKNHEASDVQVITAIIRHGSAETVMNSARSAGATGGTILENEADINPDASLFSKGTEGNDEIVLVIASKETAPAIMDALINSAGIDPTTGVIYIQDVHFVYGLKKLIK